MKESDYNRLIQSQPNPVTAEDILRHEVERLHPTPTPTDRLHSAALRAVGTTDIDEAIAWLEVFAEDREKVKPEPTLALDLAAVLNRYSAENGSDTPDHVLADYLLGCLAAFDAAVGAREKWYGRRKVLAATGDLTDEDIERYKADTGYIEFQTHTDPYGPMLSLHERAARTARLAGAGPSAEAKGEGPAEDGSGCCFCGAVALKKGLYLCGTRGTRENAAIGRNCGTFTASDGRVVPAVVPVYLEGRVVDIVKNEDVTKSWLRGEPPQDKAESFDARGSGRVPTPLPAGALSADEVMMALRNVGVDTECGACMEIAYTGSTQAEHTHQPSEPNEPSPWIPVGERLPEDAKEVFVLHHGRTTDCAWYLDNKWVAENYSTPAVTHWMPIPKVSP